MCRCNIRVAGGVCLIFGLVYVVLGILYLTINPVEQNNWQETGIAFCVSGGISFLAGLFAVCCHNKCCFGMVILLGIVGAGVWIFAVVIGSGQVSKYSHQGEPKWRIYWSVALLSVIGLIALDHMLLVYFAIKEYCSYGLRGNTEQTWLLGR